MIKSVIINTTYNGFGWLLIWLLTGIQLSEHGLGTPLNILYTSVDSKVQIAFRSNIKHVSYDND